MKKTETWFDNRWRPAMAWSYLAICIFDFLIAPIVIIWLKSSYGVDIMDWVPLTTTAGGIFHISMGAILGATAYTRGNEKIARIDQETFAMEEPKELLD